MLERVIGGKILEFLEEDLVEYRREKALCVEVWRVGAEFWCLSGLASYGEFFDTPPDIALVDRLFIVQAELDAHSLLRAMCPIPTSIARVVPFEGSSPNGAYFVALRS